jgi:hypothetical protein
MKYIFPLVFWFLMGKMIWRLILKKSAYPEYIPIKVKIVHAIILCYILVYGFSGFYSLLSLFIHPTPNTWQANVAGGSLVGLVLMLKGVAGTILLFICSEMTKRQKKALKWFFIFWPLTFLCSCYVSVIRDETNLPIQVIVFGTFLSTFVFAMTITFYLMRSSRIIWTDNLIK